MALEPTTTPAPGLTYLEIAAFIVLVLTLLANAWAAWSAARAVTHAAESASVASYFEIRRQLSDAFAALRAAGADEKARRFALVGVLNTLEAACHLYNARVFGEPTREMLRDPLAELVQLVVKDESMLAAARSAISGPRTFSQIKKFAREQGVTEAAGLVQL